MKVLQLCKKFPYPLQDGESIAIQHISKSLSEMGCELTLLSMNTSKHYYQLGIGRLPEELKHYKEIHTVDVDNTIKKWDAFKNLFSKESYHISRFQSDDFALKLISLLEDNTYDIIQMETLYLSPYYELIKSYSNAILVMRAHNIEHEIWDRITEQIDFIPKKLYLSYLAKKLKKFEVERLNKYDFLVAITERDLDKFKSLGYKNGCMAIPVGFDLDKYEPEYSAFQRPLALSFIGSLDWMPNTEGLNWFLDEVWPKLRNKYPQIEFHFAGRNASTELKNIKIAGVHYHSNIKDAKSFMQQYPISIVPLFAGSGIKVKILEAMALGRVVISSSIGLEGIPAKNMKQVIIANSVEDYLESIDYCYEHYDQIQKIGESARNFLKSNFNNERLAGKLVNAYQKVINSHSHKMT
ncbi:MAG: glycosyltransferase family 4 protein [Saprospiraceae bacterium]